MPAPQKPARRWAQPGFLFKALLVALAAATTGVACWGMIESIDATDTTFTHLWDIVDDVGVRVSLLSVLAILVEWWG